MMTRSRAVWAYRHFVLGTVQREFQVRYRNSLLGAAWSLLQPLSMIVVYTVIFSQVMRSRLPGNTTGEWDYSIYLCAGTFAWGLFSEVVTRGQNMFVDNANLLKKISFPRATLPVIALLGAMVNFAIVLGLFGLFVMLAGQWPGWVVVAYLPVVLVLLVMAMGLGITLGVSQVFFRDVGQFFGILLQFWFWLTPVVYPIGILPTNVQGLLEFNPMYPLITASHAIWVHHQWPNGWSLLYPLMLGILMCLLGAWLYKKQAGEMVDAL